MNPLDPKRFSFFGFDGLLPSMEESIKRVGIRGGPRSVDQVEECIFMPVDSTKSNGLQLGGVLDRTGRVVHAANLVRKGGSHVIGLTSDSAINPELELDEDLVYLGRFTGHFGHFLLESMARMWILSQLDQSIRVIFHGGESIQHCSVPSQILRILGVSQDRLVELNQPTRIRKLNVPAPLYELGFAAHETAADVHRLVASHILEDGGAGQSDQPVYLSRRFLSTGRRHILGEWELEQVLQENGFLVAYPERMSLADQIRLFNRHRDIFAGEGSAAHSLLFSHTSPRQHLLTGTNVPGDYFLVPTVANSHATYINSLGSAGKATTGRVATRKLPQLLDTTTILAYLDHLGLLKKPLRAKLLRQVAATRAPYDEAYLYSCIVQSISRNQDIAPEIADEADILVTTSWPLSLLLAYRELRDDTNRLEELARQFSRIVSTERDLERLARYYPDVARMIPKVAAACSADIAEELERVVSDRFGFSVSVQLKRQRAAARRKAAAPI